MVKYLQYLKMFSNESRSAIESLATSQGFYGRILENLNEERLGYLEKQNFKDIIDLILFLET